MTVSVALGCLDQLFNLGLRQVLPAAKLAVRPANRANCSFLVTDVTSFKCVLALVFAS